jgi:LacI family transcriptional regulator
VNIRELAKELSLSTSTVSRALNGYLDVNAQTRQRVQDMALALGYRPDPGARRLVRGSTDAIGIVYSAAVENLGNPQFLDMACGLSDRLEEEHLDMLLAVAKHDRELTIYERLFRGGRVDAVIVPNTRVQDNRIDYLRAKGYPFVGYGRTADCTDFSWFDFDNEAGSHLAVAHLAALGHTRFAYVHGPLDLNFAFQRHAGFIAEIEARGLVCPPEQQVTGVIDRRGGLKAVSHLMSLPTRATAIVVDSNLGGVGVIRGLIDAGVKVGQEISVVVHGDIPSDTLLPGMQVTTISQATAYQSGSTMADLVMKVLREPQNGPFQVLRQSELLVGSTSGPV